VPINEGTEGPRARTPGGVIAAARAVADAAFSRVLRGNVSMFRVFALTISVLLPLAGSGCAIVEIGMRNPVVGLETVAIAPFFNLSQERTVDGREFALDYYAELQKIPGFEVLPVGVTERAMVENGITLTGPNDAVRLAQILDVDAVVVGAVTDYDPYNPRIGLKVAWYSPRQWLFVPTEDSTSAGTRAKRVGRPKYSTARAQSPDDSDEWVSADSEPTAFRTMPSAEDKPVFIEEGDWETAGSWKNAAQVLLADAGNSRNQTLAREQSILPAGASLLVPVDDDFFPSLPQPEPARELKPAPPAEENWPAEKNWPLNEEWQRPVISVSYQNVPHSDSPRPAPAATDSAIAETFDAAPVVADSAAADFVSPVTKVVPAQGNDPEPPVTFQPSPSAQPIAPVEPEFPGPQAPTVTNEPTQLPAAEPPIQQPVTAQPADDNPFNRHLLGPPQSVEPRNAVGASRPGFSESTQSAPPRIAAAEPEFPGQSSDPAPTATMPPVAQASPTKPQTKMPGPVMRTPLFPIPQPETNRWSVPDAQATRPGLPYDEPVAIAPSQFEATEPLMAYVRLFDATDQRLIDRLSDYLELTGQLRSGDLEAHMKRSEFFRKFTAHVMISEMLLLHGGEARRRLVLKPRKYR
jgi:hypothetical protein